MKFFYEKFWVPFFGNILLKFVFCETDIMPSFDNSRLAANIPAIPVFSFYLMSNILV